MFHLNRACKVMDCRQLEAHRLISEITCVPYAGSTAARPAAATSAGPGSRPASGALWDAKREAESMADLQTRLSELKQAVSHPGPVWTTIPPGGKRWWVVSPSTRRRSWSAPQAWSPRACWGAQTELTHAKRNTPAFASVLGTLLKNLFGFPYSVGCAAFMIFMVVLMYFGDQVLSRLGKVTIPMIGMFLAVSVIGIAATAPNLQAVLTTDLGAPPAFPARWGAVLLVVYHFILFMAYVTPAGSLLAGSIPRYTPS